LAKIRIFDNRSFVQTGQNIQVGNFYLPTRTKSTAVVSAVSQGDRYARPFEVYLDGILKHKSTIMNSINEHIDLGLLDEGFHKLGIKIATISGAWVVTADVITDTIDSVEITPVPISSNPIEIAPSVDMASPRTTSPPIIGAPLQERGTMATEDRTGWEWLTKPPITRIATQEEIDAHNRDTSRAKAIAETGIVEIHHLDVIPSPNWMESNSVPLSVQAVNDRLKDIPTGILPQLNFASGTMGSAEYSPTEISNLTSGLLNAHKDNFGRDVLSFGDNFSMEPNMLLLGAGLAALAAVAFLKRDEITKIIKR